MKHILSSVETRHRVTVDEEEEEEKDDGDVQSSSSVVRLSSARGTNTDRCASYQLSRHAVPKGRDETRMNYDNNKTKGHVTEVKL